VEQIAVFLNSLKLGGAMVYPLLALAVLTAVIALEKAFVLLVRTHLPSRVVTLAETYGFDWRELDKNVASLGKRNYFRWFFRTILDNHTRPAWWVESRAADEASLIDKALGRWLWVLETIVTAAPLLGLLGTITGMIRAFHVFVAEGLVEAGEEVSGGVDEHDGRGLGQRQGEPLGRHVDGDDARAHRAP